MTGRNPIRVLRSSARGLSASSPDALLISQCLSGNQDAWEALLAKYQRLIYSIPIKYGMSPADAGDVFQQVCIQLLAKLETLRDPRSLPAWLIRITSHECFHLARREQRFQPVDEQYAPPATDSELPDRLLRELEQEQLVREAVAQLPARCRELVRMLFFETPSIPYEDVAQRLGLAKGSIGFIRMRCLKKLRQQLEAKGFL